MPNEHIAVAMSRSGHLDERQRAAFERAVMLACREKHVARRGSGDEGSIVVFEVIRGELLITVEIAHHAKDDKAETLDLQLREAGLLVFHVTGRRTAEMGGLRTAAKVVRDIPSYWEAVLRFIA